MPDDVAKPETLALSATYGTDQSETPLSHAYIACLIDSVFDPGPVCEFLKARFASNESAFTSLTALMLALRGFFAHNLTEHLKKAGIGDVDSHFLAQAQRLDAFERRFRREFSRYEPADKPNPDAVFWPIPTHPKNGRSLYQTLPMVESLDLLDKSTPIGSAGSCFAVEIARYLQEGGYNYIITETETDPARRKELEQSARWGIIFNTPSFRQLAEKAFGIRQLPRLAEYHPEGYWQDPFRENIAFPSLEALEADREAHVAACRRAFESCEVFIATLGLNECWEYVPDGSVASRNPKSPAHFALFRHRVLTPAENVANLQAFLDILRAHNPGVKMIVSLSPVPLLATGLAATHHVVVANAHSKAALRVAAEEFVRANKGVYYFPSYEMVMHCIPDPWEPDQRHVTRGTVVRIMQLFEKMFVKPKAK